MKLLLVAPTVEAERYPRGGYGFRVSNYNLPLIAALTPENVEIKVIDECVEPITFDKDYDLVGITVNTPLAPYSYDLAARYRERGSKVVLGGIHPSVLPMEGLQHADTVVIGEAETVWRQVVEDFQKGKLQRIYRAPQAAMDRIPLPRWDLTRSRRYIVNRSLTATRGCTYSCEFCSIFSAVGPGFRTRPVADVVRDIEFGRSRRMVFWDDNIIANRPYAKKLFEALAPLKVRWISQATFNFTDDDGLMRLARKAGCRGIFLGIESLLDSSLKEANKSFNQVAKYRAGIRRLHDHGIGVSAGFVFGFDHDDRSVFERTLEFAEETGIDACNFKILTPYPGTALYDRMDREGRIIDKDWSHYRGKTHVVYKPQCMPAEELLAGFKWVRSECYRWRSIIRRLFNSGTGLEAGIPMNLAYRYITRHEDPDVGWNPAAEMRAVSSVP